MLQNIKPMSFNAFMQKAKNLYKVIPEWLSISLLVAIATLVLTWIQVKDNNLESLLYEYKKVNSKLVTIEYPDSLNNNPVVSQARKLQNKIYFFNRLVLQLEPDKLGGISNDESSSNQILLGLLQQLKIMAKILIMNIHIFLSSLSQTILREALCFHLEHYNLID